MDYHMNVLIANGNTGTIYADQSWTNTEVLDGWLYVLSRGVANNTMINSDGWMTVSKGGTANSVTIKSGGLTVSSGGTGESIAVNYGAGMFVYSGGTATGIVENGGFVSLEPGASASFLPNSISGLILSLENATVHSGTTANKTTIDTIGDLCVYNGGTANNTTINSGGSMSLGACYFFQDKTNLANYTSFFVSRGGIANSTTINRGGLTILSGGTANNTTINSGGMELGTIFVLHGLGTGYIPGGVANNTTINGGGMVVQSNGTANNTIVNPDALLNVASGGTANNIVENGGWVELENGATATFVSNSFSGLVVAPSSFVTVHSGTTANSTTLNSGYLHVYSGGIANSTTVNAGGWIYFGDYRGNIGGTVNRTTINSGGTMTLLSGGTVNNTIIDSGGSLHVCLHGGTVNNTTINAGGRINAEGGTVNNTIINAGAEFKVNYGAAANETTVNSGGSFRVLGGGTANSTTINSSASLYVLNGGTANNTTVSSGGYCNVDNGGSLSDCTVYTGGSMYLAEGARLEGITTIGAGGQLSFADSGTTIDGTINLLLDIPAVEHTTAFLFNFKSTYSFDTTNLTLTVDKNAGSGTYFLIDKSEDVTSDITLTVTGTGENAGAGVFAIYDVENRIYEPVTIGNKIYSLERKQEEGRENEGLYLSIVENSPISDAAYEYIARKLAYEDGHKGYTEGQTISFDVSENGKITKYHFCIQKIYDTWGGFDAILLDRRDADGNPMFQAVLACGGTEGDNDIKLRDILSDLQEDGIGYDQFCANYDDVYDACRQMKDAGCSISFTGHSLGGALAQWFAADSYYWLGEIEDLVTFNSPGVPASNEKKGYKINNIRHYICDGDIVSLAGETFLSKANNKSSFTVFSNINLCWSSAFDYFLGQHTETLFFLDTLDEKTRDQYLSTISEGIPLFLSQGTFSYLTVRSDVNPIESTLQLKGVLAAVSLPEKDGGGYLIFNKEYAKSVLLTAKGDIDLANKMVTRKSIEECRKDPTIPFAQLILQKVSDATFSIRDYKKVTGNISVGSDNLTSTDGSTHDRIIRTLSYGKQDTPQLLFDFTEQKFIKLLHLTSTFTQEVTPATSELVIKMVLEEKGDQWVCFNIPALDESTRYMLVNAMTNTGVKLSEANYFKKGSTWYIIDDPAAEYSFTFSVDNSITTEKAVLLPETEVINKNAENVELYVSDIDASASLGKHSVSVLVKTASNPDGINVSLQETEMEGLYRGTLSVSALNLTDEDEHLTIVYEDADNGTGVAETIEKVIDIDNIEWPDYSGLVIPDVPDFFVGDFNSDGKAMLVTESDGVVSVYSDGAAWGGLTLEDGWYVAGIGDFNGDGADDFLRVNEEGYVVGEISNGDGTFSPQVLNFLNDGWDILGTGDFNGNGTDDVLIANPIAASETVGLLGYWESGSTWTLINGYSAEWECVSIGDFNGDGKCDMLWRNWFEGEDESIYNAYCTWIVDDPVDWRMVSVATPDEWDFLCAGDFDGDKMNDIAMINNEGVVGIWGVNDGYLSSWSILSAVDTSEWTLAGVGDFNADGTDDIAWCSATTGQVGCWQIENKELVAWQTLATLA